jgi:hypothetical protein
MEWPGKNELLYTREFVRTTERVMSWVMGKDEVKETYGGLG